MYARSSVLAPFFAMVTPQPDRWIYAKGTSVSAAQQRKATGGGKGIANLPVRSGLLTGDTQLLENPEPGSHAHCELGIPSKVCGWGVIGHSVAVDAQGRPRPAWPVSGQGLASPCFFEPPTKRWGDGIWRDPAILSAEPAMPSP